MSWWEVLGIDKGTELRSIKRAYARLIKQYRPETHPQEFSEIRQAYEHARDYCKGVDTTDTEVAQCLEDDLREDPNPVNTETEVPESPQAQSVDEYNDFLQILNVWAAGGFQHDASFSRLLGHKIHDNWFGFQQAKAGVFELLLESIAIADGILSTQLNIEGRQLAELDQLYRWSQEEIELHEYYDHENVALLFYGIELGYGLLPEADAPSTRMSGTRRKFVFRELGKVLLVLIVVLSLLFWVFNE